jgi:hypothetical protein
MSRRNRAVMRCGTSCEGRNRKLPRVPTPTDSSPTNRMPKCLSGVHSTNSNSSSSAVSSSPHRPVRAWGRIGERTFRRFQSGEPLMQLFPQRRSEPAPSPCGIHQPVAFPISEDQRIEVPAALTVSRLAELSRTGVRRKMTIVRTQRQLTSNELRASRNLPFLKMLLFG